MNITEIMVNSPREIYIEASNKENTELPVRKQQTYRFAMPGMKVIIQDGDIVHFRFAV